MYNSNYNNQSQQRGQYQQQQQQPVGPQRAELVLEHALGYTARPNNIVFAGTGQVVFGDSPNAMAGGGGGILRGRRMSSNGHGGDNGGGRSVDAPLIAYGCGKVVVVSNLDDPHSQRLLRGFNTPITCLDYANLNAPSIGAESNSRIGSTRINVIATGHHASPDGVCYVNFWDADSGMLVKTIPTPHKFMTTAVTSNSGGNGPIGGGAIQCVKFSPDGLMFATTGSDGSVAVMECSGGSRIAFFKDTIANDEANAIVWSSVRNSGTRDQQYIFMVPFSTGVRAFTLQFNVRSLSYDMRMDPFNAPGGGGGRTGGFQRRYLSVAQLGDDLLCGCSNGEVVVFNANNGNFRACVVVAHGPITGVVACPNYNCAFVCAADGTVKRLVGRDSEWQIGGEVVLSGSRYDTTGNRNNNGDAVHQTRCVGMAINIDTSMLMMGMGGGDYNSGAAAGGDQLVVTTSSGTIYRMLCSDMTYTVAAEGPLQAVTAIAVKDSTNKNSGNGNGSSSSGAPPSTSSLVVTCSADGAVRLWCLDDYQTIGTYFPHRGTVGESAMSNPALLSNAPNPTNSNNSGRSNNHNNHHGGRLCEDNEAISTHRNGNYKSSSSPYGGTGNAFGGNNHQSTTINSKHPMNGQQNNSHQGGVGNGAGLDFSAVPLCAVFDGHQSYSDGSEASFVVLTGWTDARIRAIDFTAAVKAFFSAQSSSSSCAGAPPPPPAVLAYEILHTHKGPIVTIDACTDYIATGGQDGLVKVWSNPCPLSPSEYARAFDSQQVHHPRDGVRPMPAVNPIGLQQQERVILTEINAHRGPITHVRIDNASSVLLHSVSADMSHKIFDLQSIASTFLNGNKQASHGTHLNNGKMNGSDFANGGGFGSTFNAQNARGGGAGNGFNAGNGTAPRCVRSHEVPQCGGFLSLGQRCDREHEAIVGTGNGQLLFFDIDTATRPVAVIADKNRVPIVTLDVWNGASSSPTSSSMMDHQRVGVGLADGTVLVYALSQGMPSYNTNNSNNGNQQPQGPAEQGVSLVFHAHCHTGAVTNMRWSPDGRQLFTAGAQGELYVWDYFAQ